MLEYGNYIQLCDSVIHSDTSEREGSGWFCSVPRGGVNTRGGKPGESELILQGHTDPPLSLCSPPKLHQCPHNHHQPWPFTPNLNLNKLQLLKEWHFPKGTLTWRNILHLHFILAVLNHEWNAAFQPLPVWCVLQIHQKPNRVKNDSVGLETGATQTRSMSQRSSG